MQRNPASAPVAIRNAALLLALLVTAAVLPAPPEEIRVGILGARGVTFRDELPWRLTEYISPAGDVNGDGSADFLLLRRNPEQDYEGEILLVHGWRDQPLPPVPTMDEVLSRSTVFRRSTPRATPWDLLEEMDSAGDMDGDRFDDFFVLRTYGAPDGWPGLPQIPGLVYLVHGAPDLPREVALDTPPDGVRITRFTSTKPTNTALALEVEAGGDLNGDGALDLVFAAGFSEREDVQTKYPQGRVYVLFGGEPLAASPGEVIDVEEAGRSRPGFILEGEADGEALGSSAELPGDVNGDGFGDLLVGAVSLYGRDPSSAYLIWGARDIPPYVTAGDIAAGGLGVRFVGGGAAWGTGSTFAEPGDLDSDGLADFLVGAPGAANQKGAVFLVYGRRDFPQVVPLDEIAGSGLGARFSGVHPPVSHPLLESGRAGEALELIDRGGPGADFLIGSPRFEEHGVSDVGRVYIVQGGAHAPGTYALGGVETGDLPGAFVTSERKGWLGSTAAVPGDVNGDGLDDFLVSAPFRYQEEVAPEVYLIYGWSGPRPLAVESVSPSVAPLAGGTEAVILGSGFDEQTSFLVGGKSARVLRLETTARAVIEVPPGDALGRTDVEARRRGDTAGLPGAVRYVAHIFPDLDVRSVGTGQGLKLKGHLGSLALLDFDGDGLADIAARFPTEGGFIVAYGSRAPGAEIEVPEPVRGQGGAEGFSVVWSAEEIAATQPLPVGDVNGDGSEDLAVVSSGHITLLFGGARRPREVWMDDLVADGLGAQILFANNGFPAGGGDFDGDGFGDLLVRVWDDNFSTKGTVHWIRGRRTWPPEQFLEDAPALRSEVPEDRFGNALAFVDDMNGDGRDELLIGAQGRFWSDDGNAYLVWGAEALEGLVEDLLARGAATRFDAFKAMDSLGHEACPLGDFSGDGLPDFALSAEGGGEEFAGESYVVFGGPSLERAAGENTLSMAALGEAGVRIPGDFGYDYSDSIEPAGDFNGDGLADLLIASSGSRSPPKVYVVFGGPARTVDLGDFTGEGLRILCEDDAHGPGQLAGGGDFNGDGLEDIVIAGPRSQPGFTGAWVVFGRRGESSFLRGDSDGDGAVVITDPIALLGALFLGTVELACQDAADANDDGKLDITDAIHVLSYLFSGGPEPRGPFPDAGADPTADGLDCAGP